MPVDRVPSDTSPERRFDRACKRGRGGAGIRVGVDERQQRVALVVWDVGQ
jgi:hypothetical protein